MQLDISDYIIIAVIASMFIYGVWPNKKCY